MRCVSLIACSLRLKYKEMSVLSSIVISILSVEVWSSFIITDTNLTVLITSASKFFFADFAGSSDAAQRNRHLLPESVWNGLKVQWLAQDSIIIPFLIPEGKGRNPLRFVLTDENRPPCRKLKYRNDRIIDSTIKTAAPRGALRRLSKKSSESWAFSHLCGII